MTASRSGRLFTTSSWMRNAGYPSKCAMLKKPLVPSASTACFSPRSSTMTARMGPEGGSTSPNRRMSALVNGRSHANPFLPTSHVRWPCRTPIVTSGRSATMRSTSSKVAGIGGLLHGWTAVAPRLHALDLRAHAQQRRFGRGAGDDLYADRQVVLVHRKRQRRRGLAGRVPECGERRQREELRHVLEARAGQAADRRRRQREGRRDEQVVLVE